MQRILPAVSSPAQFKEYRLTPPTSPSAPTSSGVKLSGVKKITRALLSVTDKTALVDFARSLASTASSSSPPAAPPALFANKASPSSTFPS